MTAYWTGHTSDGGPCGVRERCWRSSSVAGTRRHGCSRQITGTAQVDPNQPSVDITKDKFGIRAGSDDAPVQLELYTEPQCSHCADLQADFGDQLAYYIGIGQLAVTYRPLTFLDTGADGHSAHVANALFAAAPPGRPRGGGTATAPRIPEVRRGPLGTPGHRRAGPTDDEMADMAKSVGISRRSRSTR